VGPVKRNLRSAAVGARKKVLRRRRREILKRVCCELCEKKLPGRHGAEQFRPTANAAALRDQDLNS
jgi:hypothetical protein